MDYIFQDPGFELPLVAVDSCLKSWGVSSRFRICVSWLLILVKVAQAIHSSVEQSRFSKTSVLFVADVVFLSRLYMTQCYLAIVTSSGFIDFCV